MLLNTYHSQSNRTVECRRFESVADMIAFCRQVPASRVKGHDHTANPSFAGRDFGGSWEAVYSAMNTAWAEGLEIVDRMMADLADANLPQPTSRKRRMRFDEADGDELEYDRLRSGQDFWRATRRQSTRGPATITIVVDVMAHFGVKARDILWRGAAAIALAQMLEAAGYRVELWAMGRTNEIWRRPGDNRDSDALMAVCLKETSDALDPSTLVCAISGWSFRTMFFRAYSCGEGTLDDGLGYCSAPRDEDVKQITTDETRVLISDAMNYNAAVAKVREVLSRLAN